MYFVIHLTIVVVLQLSAVNGEKCNPHGFYCESCHVVGYCEEDRPTNFTTNCPSGYFCNESNSHECVMDADCVLYPDNVSDSDNVMTSTSIPDGLENNTFTTTSGASVTEQIQPSTLRPLRCVDEFKSFPDPDSCKSYFRCTNSVLEKFTCPESTWFDSISQQCQENPKSKCGAEDVKLTSGVPAANEFSAEDNGAKEELLVNEVTLLDNGVEFVGQKKNAFGKKQQKIKDEANLMKKFFNFSKAMKNFISKYLEKEQK